MFLFPSCPKFPCILVAFSTYSTSGHAHGLSLIILKTHGLLVKILSPIKPITLPLKLLVTNISLYFIIEWDIFNSVSPFTVPTKTCRFCDSEACALKSLAFVLSPPNSYCPFSILCKNFVEVAVSPTRAAAAGNANHLAWGLFACWYGIVTASEIGGGTNVLPPFVIPPPAFSCSQFPHCILSFSQAAGDVTTSSFVPATVPLMASSDGAHVFSSSPWPLLVGTVLSLLLKLVVAPMCYLHL